MYSEETGCGGNGLQQVKIIAKLAKRGNEHARRQLWEQFEPRFAKWARLAARNLPRHASACFNAEKRSVFLLLLLEFEPERGVPFAPYADFMLRRRLHNYVQQERVRLGRGDTGSAR